MNIALIGYRATGKTSVAKPLARILGWSWIDSDVEVELKAGKSIAAIFAGDGEQAFRDLEASVVRSLAKREKCVLALGGGAVLRDETRTLLCTTSRVVWLKASPDTIWQRLQQDPATASQRPNLTSQGGLAEIKTVLEQRTPIYRSCAEIEVDTEHGSPQALAAQIVARLGIAPAGSDAQ